MPRKNNKKGSQQSALGRALMHSRFAPPTTISQRHTTTTTAMLSGQSVTQESDLDSFLHTAELAATDFTAEKLNVTVFNPNLSSRLKNPYLLTAEQESEKLALYKEYESQLCIPKRPAWTSTTTPEELHQAERNAFLDWRRHLAHLEEDKGLLMTPFEKNLEIWKQLWRVVERCDLLVQIVDARNPELFRCPDLEAYVLETDPQKKNLLLLNKADLLTVKQRMAWADYFDTHGISYRFFSASISKQRQDEEKERLAQLEESFQDDLYVVDVAEDETSSYVMVSSSALPKRPSPRSSTQHGRKAKPKS